MSKIKLRVIGPNQTEIEMGGRVLFFTYETLVLVRDLDVGVCYTTTEKYSKTTTKYTNAYVKDKGITLDRVQFVSQGALEDIGEGL